MLVVSTTLACIRLVGLNGDFHYVLALLCNNGIEIGVIKPCKRRRSHRGLVVILAS